MRVKTCFTTLRSIVACTQPVATVACWVAADEMRDNHLDVYIQIYTPRPLCDWKAVQACKPGGKMFEPVISHTKKKKKKKNEDTTHTVTAIIPNFICCNCVYTAQTLALKYHNYGSCPPKSIEVVMTCMEYANQLGWCCRGIFIDKCLHALHTLGAMVLLVQR